MCGFHCATLMNQRNEVEMKAIEKNEEGETLLDNMIDNIDNDVIRMVLREMLCFDVETRIDLEELRKLVDDPLHNERMEH